MEGDEVGIFSKVSDRESLLLLKIKIKQNLGCPNKDIFISTFMGISGPI